MFLHYKERVEFGVELSGRTFAKHGQGPECNPHFQLEANFLKKALIPTDCKSLCDLALAHQLRPNKILRNLYTYSKGIYNKNA